MEQVADIFTKPLGQTLFEKFSERLIVINTFSRTR